MMGTWIILVIFLTIAVKRPATSHTTYACEGQELEIICDKGKIIHLKRANYGRFSIVICNEHGSLNWSVDCASQRSYYVIHNRCNHMARCMLSASSNIFDDPCPGTFKYLEVQYECMSESLTRLIISSSATVNNTTTPVTPTVQVPVIIPITRAVRPKYFSEVPTQFPTSSSMPTVSVLTSVSTYSSYDSVILNDTFSTPYSILEPTKARINSTVFNKNEYCPSVESRNLTWKSTKAGESIEQKCPGGTYGEARWFCGLDPVQWVPDTPDLSECSSVWVENLKSRVNSGESVLNIAVELSVMVHRKPLYGGDVRHAIKILHILIEKMMNKVKEVVDDKESHHLLQELFEITSDITSNLFNVSPSWKDISVGEKKHLSSTLIEAIEHSGWLLVLAQRSPFNFSKNISNMFVSVQTIEAWTIAELMLPSADKVHGTTWEEIQNSVILPIHAISDITANGYIRLVIAFYRGIGHFLGTASLNDLTAMQNSSRIINSWIISVFIGPVTNGKNKVKLMKPITITFKLIQDENVTNPQCVYWDMDLRLWSLDGCRLKRANLTHAICKCDHLTSFALLMDVRNGSMALMNDLFQSKILVFSSCALAMLFFFITIFLLHIFRSNHNALGYIHQHLSFCLLIAEIIYVASVGGINVSCFILSGLLHFALQAVFLWLFLSNLHLCLMLKQSNNILKTRFYSLLAYGISSLSSLIVVVVAVSNSESYWTNNYCFLSFENYYVFGFVGPSIACLIGAFVVLMLNIIKTYWPTVGNKGEVKIQFFRLQNCYATLVLLLCGSCWSFLLFYMKEDFVILAFIFSCLNVLQGLAVFVCLGLSNYEVQHAYKRWKHGQPKLTADVLPSPTTSSSFVEFPFLQAPALPTHSTVASQEFEYQLPCFHHADLCHNTRSPIYDNQE